MMVMVMVLVVVVQEAGVVVVRLPAATVLTASS